MNDGHRIIANFIHTLKEIKGEKGQIHLEAWHWKSGPLDTATARGFSNGAEFMQSGVKEKKETADTPSGQDKREKNNQPGSQTDWDGTITAGELVAFQGRAPISGHIHLFNLGTSGSCLKLAPSRQFPDNRIVACEDFHLPSPDLFDASLLIDYGFPVTWPAGSVNMQPERLLAIVTREDEVVQIEDLDPSLFNRHGCGDVLGRCVSRGGPSIGGVETGKANLISRPESWEYGLLEMEVLHD